MASIPASCEKSGSVPIKGSTVVGLKSVIYFPLYSPVNLHMPADQSTPAAHSTSGIGTYSFVLYVSSGSDQAASPLKPKAPAAVSKSTPITRFLKGLTDNSVYG